MAMGSAADALGQTLREHRHDPPHPLDIALGARIREVREAQEPRVLQQWVAREIGCTAKQIQKYESGENRVSFSQLCKIARALDISVIDLIRPVVPKHP